MTEKIGNETNATAETTAPTTAPTTASRPPIFICMVNNQIVAADSPRGPQLLLCQDQQGVERLSEMAQRMVNSVTGAGSEDVKIEIVRYEQIAVERVFQKQLVQQAPANAVPNIRLVH